MAERPGQIAGVQCHLTQPELRGAPRLAARDDAAGGLGQQRVLTGQPAAQQPPRRQRDRQPQRAGRVVLHGPAQHLAHRGVLGIQQAGRGHLPAAGLQPGRGLIGHSQRVPSQGRGRSGILARRGQQPGPVGAQRLQHHIPGPAIGAGPRRDQQRAVHQVQHRRPGPGPGDRLGGLQGERPREHRDPAEHPPLVLIEQLVAPLHGGRQRLLPAGRQPVPGRQQREPVIDPVQQLRHPQRLHPRRRQLDRQRHPIQPRHQPPHQRPGLPIQHEMRIRAAGPVREQRHRFGSLEVRIIGAGHQQRRQPVPGLPRGPQRLLAGRQDPHIIAGSQQLGAQRRNRADHMLAAIQHQQQLPPGQHTLQRGGRRDPRPLPHPQRHRHRRGHPRRVSHRRQFRQPRPVREPARHPPGHLSGQPGLAHTTRPGHRHQPVLPQQARDLSHSRDPADEAGQRSREAMHATGHGGHRRRAHAGTIAARAACVQPSGPARCNRCVPMMLAAKDVRPVRSAVRMILTARRGRLCRYG